MEALHVDPNHLIANENPYLKLNLKAFIRKALK